ncbi:O-antigen ligase family protein [Flavobacterium subsaxonicum]|uniref:O-antigen ligase-related domain-containing protein n=1 Tax=Flavobacterium subsaxonicum WB 4.1-42 = DSM 21790 TaxID=1121898 RepID=A0A0A2MJB9_9FLAO|nr:O-antigen ligase family protein [Flavobacterium subsaxonicum]KGO92702.1 hypothetical protein Q766_11315 [Flavobacterium subsaxonicum WB 4.1-42 = DSM 21790]
MKTRNQIVYLSLFVILILLQLYLPSFKINVLIQIAALGFCAYDHDISFNKRFLNYTVPIGIILVVGCIGTFIYSYKFVPISKDIFHFIKPLTGILLGYIIFKKINNFKLFIRAVIIAAILSACIHFYVLAFMVRFRGGIEDIREFTKDNFLELFALFFLIYFKKFEGSNILFKKIYLRAAILFLTVSCITYFSRTMIIMWVVLMVSVYGLTKITTQTIRFFVICGISTGLLYLYLFSANISRGKPGIEGFLYKIKMAPEEVFKTKIDRDNKADLWDHWRGYEAKRAIALMNSQPESYIFGTGMGSLVNLKFYAPLTGEPKGIRYISELHNGYIYILYKTGFIGILIYLFMLARWYGYIYKKFTLLNIVVSAIGLEYLVSTVTISGIYNTRDAIIFILGGALYYANSGENNLILQRSTNEQH